jgi:lipoprotein-anchoring transpeptidase ErfK/SrfK
MPRPYRLRTFILAAVATLTFSLQAFAGSSTAASFESCRRWVKVNLAAQTLTVYQNGFTVLKARISSGRKGKETPRGKYVITEKDPHHHSNLYDGASMPWFLRLTDSGVGIHYGPNPGHPASHGCVRIGSVALAKQAFQSCPLGTTVIIE